MNLLEIDKALKHRFSEFKSQADTELNAYWDGLLAEDSVFQELSISLEPSKDSIINLPRPCLFCRLITTLPDPIRKDERSEYTDGKRLLEEDENSATFIETEDPITLEYQIDIYCVYPDERNILVDLFYYYFPKRGTKLFKYKDDKIIDKCDVWWKREIDMTEIDQKYGDTSRPQYRMVWRLLADGFVNARQLYTYKRFNKLLYDIGVLNGQEED